MTADSEAKIRPWKKPIEFSGEISKHKQREFLAVKISLRFVRAKLRALK